MAGLVGGVLGLHLRVGRWLDPPGRALEPEPGQGPQLGEVAKAAVRVVALKVLDVEVLEALQARDELKVVTQDAGPAQQKERTSGGPRGNGAGGPSRPCLISGESTRAGLWLEPFAPMAGVCGGAARTSGARTSPCWPPFAGRDRTRRDSSEVREPM